LTYTFVVPDMRASVTGGNVYNLGLTRALGEIGANVRVVDRDVKAAEQSGDGPCFVDTLYLEHAPRFAPYRLLVHYLPSLVEGRAPSAIEQAAIANADGFVVPSAFMRDAMAELSSRPIAIVAPGIDIEHAPVSHVPRAVMVANLVSGKGVLAFLEALDGPLELAIIGADHDPSYAAACRAAAPLARFLGALPHARTIAEIAASDFLVSASRMESYGLALAEARALGVPILARAGGNAGAHADVTFDSDEALARACLALARDRTEIERRRRIALANRAPPRSWSDAARDFIAAFKD
jgi:glycosyltransferase involved in cell wall biosynthesis